MSFFKHVGEHNKKKVVIVQRQIPGEDHMCSVIYSDIVPSRFHDDIMKVLESNEGQAANEFWQILQRRQNSDGNNMLHAIALEGYLKKVPANQVTVKPNANSSVRLDELNKLLREVGTGDHARQKLEEMDAQQGLRDPIKQHRFTSENVEQVQQTPQPPTQTPENNGVLSDSDLAEINIKQASTMKQEADRLTQEADRLVAEAYELDPSKKPATKTNRKSRGKQSEKSVSKTQ